MREYLQDDWYIESELIDSFFNNILPRFII